MRFTACSCSASVRDGIIPLGCGLRCSCTPWLCSARWSADGGRHAPREFRSFLGGKRVGSHTIHLRVDSAPRHLRPPSGWKVLSWILPLGPSGQKNRWETADARQGWGRRTRTPDHPPATERLECALFSRRLARTDRASLAPYERDRYTSSTQCAVLHVVQRMSCAAH